LEGFLGARKSFKISIKQTAYEGSRNKEFRFSHGMKNSTSAPYTIVREKREIERE
jgi:hypothetical protein